jgi:thiosulfate/3-mercaptopyruvate sulfurtransferase
MFTTLIDCATLSQHLRHPGWVIVDCRFDLTDPARGERMYYEAHIPGARYAHLDRDLSGTKTGRNGRHPMPSAEQMRERFGAMGIGPGVQVVAYDADTGMYAARLWWMLRFMGHEQAAVLDGGIAAWLRAGHELRGGRETWSPATFAGQPRENWRVTVDDITAKLGDDRRVLIDARAPARYRGESEPLDRIAGHIPGARNRFFQDNLTEEKTFKSPAELRAEWQQALAGAAARDVVVYCGSGVTACHDLLALAHAGLPDARLYPGSWSEWCADPDRPVETGS